MVVTTHAAFSRKDGFQFRKAYNLERKILD